MIPPALWHQARRIWFRARRDVVSQMGGSHRSLFRGTGLAFEEVRPYEPGDDVRAIDWNVTARMGEPFLKRYVEERELTWMILLDISRSMDFTTGAMRKREIAVELAALTAALALFHGDRVGLLLFGSKLEGCWRPRKGGQATLSLLQNALVREPKAAGSNLDQALRQASRLIPRRSLVLLVSDFLGGDFGPAFRAMGRRHDLIAVRIVDPREQSWPPTGLVRLRDLETGEIRLVDAQEHAERLRAVEAARSSSFSQAVEAAKAQGLTVSTTGAAAHDLLEAFRRRAQPVPSRRH